MNNLESEIAELQKMIEAKRDQLEKEVGIVEEKELVRQSVREMFLDTTTPPLSSSANPLPAQSPTPVSTPSVKVQPNSASASYLDYLDADTTEKINHLIEEIPAKGVALVIDEVAAQEPFVIDAFHDALVDKLYDELKARGLVK